MIDFSLSDEQAAIRETARRFVEEQLIPLEPEVLRRERTGAQGFEEGQLEHLQEEARRFGFWGLQTPERFGGMDLPDVTHSLIWTELGRTFVPFTFGGHADNILYECQGEQVDRYLRPTIEGERRSCFALTEPEAGSDLSNLRAVAKRDGEGWVISGEKTFITGGLDADFAIVIARTDPDVDVRHGATAFLVDRERGWTSSPIDTMGEMVPATIHLDAVPVGPEHVLGRVGDGFSLAMRWISRGRYVIPSRAIGIAERVLEIAIEHARHRMTFGRPLADRQAIQWMIADSEVELEAARWLTLRAAWERDQGRDARHPTSIAKLNGATMVNQVVDRAMQVLGGVGYTRELPLERWYREVRVFRIYEGSDEMQRRMIARDLFRGHTRIGQWID